MIRKMKTTLWLVGIIILVCLVSYPLQEAKDAWTLWSSPLSGKIIVLDPGHGGADGGAEGTDGTQEKDITLRMSEYLRDYLQEAGALVYLTRNEDKDLASENAGSLSRRKSEDIRNRVQYIKEKEADFYLSIHLNAIPSPKWRGAQTFFNSNNPQSEHLAKFIQSEIRTNLENTDRQAMDLTSIYLLKHVEAPGALVEAGFLSNGEERELLKSEEYQRKMAASIYQGVLRYVTEREYPSENGL
ncbi:N-acetylmuramoyl-L-alanine amidase CwlD [Halobacillus halophilus]|uniref:N-acetylmuramoyl-L-alanine amidase n=1 Tax=Halobacillus halophilus (strain ATCC 35676 / DSM 2266 / JCM 20832 / KCTC 3685 / LMG 17431 / NBRC 102448 / NCIMB 2269) TaxID=866895 RepID=I0JHD1_HALH3|nr:N-acetylmuramoyl-L-alanine amidase CwlD [Halobacillus halophilus]ASF37772.1 N-acetylmuramoyl-L-alanine amidase CwlD [Halobacillus halophilus]CCG43549.1 N-acetylmuramoyl-L-alanine amidase [Halobacillus halophilus DSM 2266]